MKRHITALLTVALAAGAGIAKRPLDHKAFDSWESVKNYGLTRDGSWEAYAVNPQEGDGTLYLHPTSKGKDIKIERGYALDFTADSRWAVALIKPHHADTRKAKIAKKKKFDLPQDSLAIIDLKRGRVEKIGRVISYELGRDGGDWVAYLSCDTALISKKGLGDDKAGRPMVVRNLSSGTSKTVNWVKSYRFSRLGDRLGLTMKKMKGDTLATDGVGVMLLPDTSLVVLDHDKCFYGPVTFDYDGRQVAYTASNDSNESGTLKAAVYLATLAEKMPVSREIPLDITERQPVNLQPAHASDPQLQAQLEQRRLEAIKASMGQRLYVNQYSKVTFSHNGRRLVVGVAPEIAPDDTTIVSFEQPALDIWRWDAPYTPPQENHRVEALRKHGCPVVVDLATMGSCLLTSNPLVKVEAPDRWDADWALLLDPSEVMVTRQWDYYAPEKTSLVNVLTGERLPVGQAYDEDASLSPDGKYVLWFYDGQYHAYDIASRESRCISEGVAYPLWDEEQDTPGAKANYGVAGWSSGDDRVIVYDRYDLWSLDPTGESAPVCLTRGEGRKAGMRYRYIETDPERRSLKSGDLMLLGVFDHATKENGFATMTFGAAAAPRLRLLDKYTYTQIRKALKAEVYSWQRANFNTLPDIWESGGLDFARAKQLSHSNPQASEYYLGDARLVKWRAYDGKEAEGVLYVPEDFDPSRKYPMLAVFYERNSENLYRHYTVEPSWSWVNYPFYVSRGYVVFVPDIRYTVGLPGESAYNYVCSGVESLCDRYEWIDRERIGIDGQSWGGYQTAYLVTRTDMFACAGSGAPVANMTSAFGGIRWESGDSRQAQYEKGQSRIGRNLWEAPQLYMANSPVFYADRVTTPLLIMHNDADGAVPWYQGIEMFMALRRLGKPVWMLQYNGEAHNIRARKNRKDITVRLQQFFDHYLKDAPMPLWMKEGIPAVRKGQILNYETEND